MSSNCTIPFHLRSAVSSPPGFAWPAHRLHTSPGGFAHAFGGFTDGFTRCFGGFILTRLSLAAGRSPSSWKTRDDCSAEYPCSGCPLSRQDFASHAPSSSTLSLHALLPSFSPPSLPSPPLPFPLPFPPPSYPPSYPPSPSCAARPLPPHLASYQSFPPPSVL